MDKTAKNGDGFKSLQKVHDKLNVMAEVKSHFTEYPLMELFWNIGKNFGLGLHRMLILSTVVQFICFDAR